MLKRTPLIGLLYLSFLFALAGPVLADSWINPRQGIGDPWLARLQQGRKELTPGEKEDLGKYGYTGLEVMTYLDANKEPGRDSEAFYRATKARADGSIEIREELRKRKYYRKDYRANLTYEGIQPGGIWCKRYGITLYPPDTRGQAWIANMFLRSEKFSEFEEGWTRFLDLRRPKRYVIKPGDSSWVGSEMTMDDYRWRRPWEEDHRVLGEERYGGHDCLVIESRHRLKPNYYLSKRVSWVDREIFVDYHEEQFDRQDRLFKISENTWVRVPPWNYLVRERRHFYNLLTRNAFLMESFGWILDQGLREQDFARGALNREIPWRSPQNSPPFFQKASALPAPPEVQRSFWERLGLHPKIANRD